MMKEAIFAALGPAAEAERVLDLYAGSGQLGIEALSRGACHADFVDSGRLARRTIGRNLVHTGFTAQGRIWRPRLPGALAVLAKRGRGPYDLVLIDPPYAAPELDAVLAELGTGALLADEAWVAVEHTKTARAGRALRRAAADRRPPTWRQRLRHLPPTTAGALTIMFVPHSEVAALVATPAATT